MTYPVILCNTKENIRRVRRLCSFIENNSSLRRITIDHLVLDTQTIQMLIRSSRSLPNLDDLCLNETRLSPSVSSAYEDVGLLRTDLFTSSLKRLCWKPARSPAETSVTNSGTFMSLAEGFPRNISLCGKTIFPNLEELALVGPNHKWGFDLMSLHATTLKRVSIELDSHCDPLLCPPDAFSRLKRLTHLQLFFSKPCHAVHVLSLLEADAHKLPLQSLRIVLPEHFEDFVHMLDPLLSSIASRLSHSLTEIGLCLGHDLEDGNSYRRVFGWLNLSLFRLLYTSDGLLGYDEPSIWWV
ncbi:hypothetical protein BT96DRAFT_990227 [Gymnopus androsaceus JB14]|uniref:Uncharacterized protein n=1 Tax=Gymnopus androsaceus JB14 TaxID=1447944 RepID=A0A6A4HYF3_9AGAR|nr:hypothetical protein BT96DRAFT_990227 [Gymnopus androsaceus JB14]